jgi:hypothetical protein
MITRFSQLLSQRLIGLLILLAPAILLAQDDARPLTIDDLMSMKSLSGPVLSPEGDWVVYSVRERDMEEDKSSPSSGRFQPLVVNPFQ